MGRKRKRPGRKNLRACICVFLCALMLFQTAEASSGAAGAPPGGVSYESESVSDISADERKTIGEDLDDKMESEQMPDAEHDNDSESNDNDGVTLNNSADQKIAVFSYEKGMTVEPLLNMPGKTYEGHKIIMSDASSFRINGERTELKEIYDTGKAWLEFIVTDGKGQDAEDIVDIRRGKCEKYQREAVFSIQGNYGIEMVIHTSDGKEYSRKQRINVEKAPDTTSGLTGAKKENRLQSIEFRTAQNPTYPLKSLHLDITAGEGTEKASVEFVKGGEVKNRMSGAQHIKLRNAGCPLTEDGFFRMGRVEFMSTFSDDTRFKYTIVAEDTRGQKYVYDDTFTVETDKAPAAAMDIASSYIREADSDEAVVELEDLTQTDGDTVERRWYVKYKGEDKYRDISKEPGYTDMSDGRGARVSFKKKGVGEFYVRLDVSDVWSEGTMDEYTSNIPRLSDSTECSSEVVNIAPHISLGTHALHSADIVVLSGKNDDWNSLKQDLAEKFLSKGTEIYFSADKVDISLADGKSAGYTEKFESISDFGYHGADSAFEDDLYIVDNSNLYYMEATWTDPDRGYPEEPFTVIAKDGEKGEELWHYTVTSDIFSVDISKSRMFQDDTEKYIYITSSGKTLVMLKNTGQPVNVLDYEVGEYNFVYDDTLYTFKSDGIYRISLKDGRISSVWRGNMSGTVRRIGGMPVTYIKTAQESIMKLSLELSSGNVKSKYIGKLTSDLYLQNGNQYGKETTLNVAGIDASGKAVVEVNTPVYNESTSYSLNCYKAVIQVYEADGSLIKQFVRTNSEGMNTVPVADTDGMFNYLAVTYSGRHKITAEVNGIYNDYSATYTESNKNGDPAYFDQIIYSWESDGKVWLTLGGICAWIYDQSWANGPQHGYPERCTNISFDLSSGRAAEGSLPAGCSGFTEYSRSSDIYTAVHTARNSQYVGMAKVDNRVVRRSQRVYSMLYRAMRKNLRTDNDPDHKVLLLRGIDAGSSLSAAEIKSLSQLAESAGYDIYIAGEEGYGGAFIEGAEYISDDESMAQTLAESVTGEKIKDHKYTSVEVTADRASLKRMLDLSSNKEYYFEYNVKADKEPEDPVSVSHSLLPVLNDETYGDDEYYVTGYEIEDFNDDDLNDFFSYSNYDSKGGMYTDCYRSRPSKTNVYIERDSEIRFTVEEGRSGVLSFDYIIFNVHDGDDLNANYAEIDGERWDRSPGYTGNGKYTHPRILGPGEHTLKLHTSGYGGRLINYTYIDDLKLSYISRDVKDRGAGSQIYDMSVSKRSDGIYRVTGRFYTPGDAACYREMKGVEYVSGTAGEAKYTRLETTEDDQTFYMDIPDSKTAVSSWVKLITKCSSDYKVSYVMEELPQPIYYGKLKNEAYKLRDITNQWKYIFPALSGDHVFRTYIDSYRRTSGSFNDIEMYIVDDSNILIDGYSYIKSERKNGDKTLFLGEKGYGDKTEIKLNVDKSVKELYDFRLYTIEAGQKVYVTDNDLTDRDTLKNWHSEDVHIKYGEYSADDVGDIPVFSKGQYIDYNVTYWDHEGDPSKRSYWRYTHTPYNDGEYEYADTILDREGNVSSERGIILDEPVTRFYKDGKYTVEHWQEDDTTRGAVPGGAPAYDKESNHVFITFYIGGAGDAPWIRYIKTVPSDIYEGDAADLEISVDDALKQKLSLETDIYSGDKVIYHKEISEITASNGKYDNIILNDVITAAACGRYKVVCTLSSVCGTGSDSISFMVMSRGNIEGSVYHTDKWDFNRKCADREQNVFWPGERIMLKADVEGRPARVIAWIEGEDGLESELLPAEDGVYRGCIWSDDMIFRWGSDVIDKKIIFRAEYDGGNEKLSECNITLDNSRLYWNVHRTQGA